MIFRRFAAPLLFLSVLGAVAAMLGGAAGCGGDVPIGDTWACTAPDGGDPQTFNAADPSVRPAGCACAIQGPPTGPGGVRYTYPQGDCAGLDTGADGGPIPAGDASDAGDAVDATADGPTAPPCQCEPWPPEGWADPQLVWIGPEPEAPPCPGTGLLLKYQGAIDLDAGELACGQCGCAPPDGGCVLPTTLTTNSTACPAMAPSNVQTPFGAPAGWDGGCTTADAIDGGALCEGGPCVVSLTIAAPTVAETGCTAIQPPTPDAGLSMSYAVACIGEVALGCATGFYCLPPATGFHVCVAQQGDDDCPGSPYTEKHLAFGGFDDARSCSPCTCGAPSGGKCTARISVYADDACATDATDVETIDSTMPEWCADVTAAPLLSKSASPPAYVPGSCQPQPAGGVPSGSVTPTTPMTFCCVPAPTTPTTP